MVQFPKRSKAAYVLVLTVIAIAATYGLSGWLQFAGVNMTFNAAIIPFPRSCSPSALTTGNTSCFDP